MGERRYGRPVGIEPDTKDWTWVLDRPCPECGFDAAAVSLDAVPDAVRENARAWRAVLRRRTVRDRPSDGTWSPLEYACHVRDTCRIFTERLALMRERDDPLFPNWDQDETAVADRYGEQDPAAVTVDLERNAGVIAEAFERVPAGEWSRTGRRSDGAVFTIASLARYFLHDPVHHLRDVAG